MIRNGNNSYQFYLDVKIVTYDWAKDMKNVWFVIAAFNEEGVISKVLDEIFDKYNNVVVVDDCSTDGTVDIIKLSKAKLIQHPINLGQGAALQTGIEYALINNAEIIVTYDADGQHRIEDAIRLINGIENDEADIICGSRFLGMKSLTMPLSKKLVLKLATLFTRMTTGVPVSDAHNGLRAMSYYAAQKINITQNRMAHASELISEISRHKLRYKEYPIIINYTDYSINKGQKIHNAINILIDLLLGRISK